MDGIGKLYIPQVKSSKWLMCCIVVVTHYPLCVALFRKNNNNTITVQNVWFASVGTRQQVFLFPALIGWTATLCCHVNNCWVTSRTPQITADSLRCWGKPLMIVEASLSQHLTMPRNRLKMNIKTTFLSYFNLRKHSVYCEAGRCTVAHGCSLYREAWIINRFSVLVYVYPTTTHWASLKHVV